MIKTAAVMIADGSEPIETITPVDALRRAGVEVTLVSASGTFEVKAAHGVTVTADALVEDVNLHECDMLVVPGGSVGVENLGKCAKLSEALCDRMAANKGVASICAGPTILADLDLLQGRRAVCYPGCETGFPAGAYQQGEKVVVDDNLITSAGPATALPFALAIVHWLVGEAIADQVAMGMLVNY